MEGTMSCPFSCGYKADGGSEIMLHIETVHPEGDYSPFVVKDVDEDANIAAMLSLEEDIQYASCPIGGCGEAVLLTELDSHIEMHSAEGEESEEETSGSRSPPFKRAKNAEGSSGGVEAFGTKLSHALRNLEDGERVVEARKENAKLAWKNILKMPASETKGKAAAEKGTENQRRRLGKKELGPHAHEAQMPPALVKLLESDGETKTINRKDPDGKIKVVRICPNRMQGILPVIEQLLTQDRSSDHAYLCHHAVRHVSKLKKEGGFCGYRNIQMLCSYITAVKSQGYDSLDNKIPSIFDIQEYIETAWDLGINFQGRIETGGIRGTRKYIGTPDAQAMCLSLGIACDAQGLKSNRGFPQAMTLLLQEVENYFISGTTSFDTKVRRTSLPPLYFQHPGHSMTIVGFEKRRDGTKNLIVFDPMFHDAVKISKFVGQEVVECRHPGELLKAYRREGKYLRRYSEFELLKLTPPDNQKGNVTPGSWD